MRNIAGKLGWQKCYKIWALTSRVELVNFISYIKGVKCNIRNHQTFMGAHLMHRAKIKYPPVPLPIPAAEMESSNEGNEIIEHIKVMHLMHVSKMKYSPSLVLPFPRPLFLARKTKKFCELFRSHE